MNFKERLEKEHSKKLTEEIVQEIVQNPGRLGEFMDVFLGDSHRTTQKAAWVLSFLAEKNPDLLRPYLARLTTELTNRAHHPAVRRNIVRAFQFMDIPEDISGSLTDVCFTFLNDNEEPVAVKVFSMSILLRMVKKYPDLGRELRFGIEDQIERQSAAFKSRGGRVLAALDKMGIE